MATTKTRTRKSGSSRRSVSSRSRSAGRTGAKLICTESGTVTQVDECGCVERRRIWNCEEAS